MSILTKFGTANVGDYVEFKHDGEKYLIGKISSVTVINTIPFVDMYVVDNTGGYHVSVPISSIERMASINHEEDVSKPKRYNKVGKFECWDVIIDQEMDFLEGSILKYLWRHKQKNGPHDLKKAVEYLNKMIKDYDKLYKK